MAIKLKPTLRAVNCVICDTLILASEAVEVPRKKKQPFCDVCGGALTDTARRPYQMGTLLAIKSIEPKFLFERIGLIEDENEDGSFNVMLFRFPAGWEMVTITRNKVGDIWWVMPAEPAMPFRADIRRYSEDVRPFLKKRAMYVQLGRDSQLNPLPQTTKQKLADCGGVTAENGHGSDEKGSKESRQESTSERKAVTGARRVSA